MSSALRESRSTPAIRMELSPNVYGILPFLAKPFDVCGVPELTAEVVY